jgi:hypothetical protein
MPPRPAADCPAEEEGEVLGSLAAYGTFPAGEDGEEGRAAGRPGRSRYDEVGPNRGSLETAV